MLLARTDSNYEHDWLIDDFSLQCIQSIERTSFYQETLLTLLKNENIAQSRDDFNQLITKLWFRLPSYDSYTSFLKYNNKHLLQNLHKELAYLLIIHPKFLEQHPLFFGLQKETLNHISQKIWDISEYHTRIDNMQQYLYRLPNFGVIKNDYWFLGKMREIYDNSYFLSNSLHEIILVDMIAKDLFPHCTVWLASNIDDRRFWFDAIIMSPQKRFCFIDFTFSDDEQKLEEKKSKMKTIARSKKILYNSEFAIHLFEQHAISLIKQKKKWVVFKINKTVFEKQWLPDYLQYVYPWINNRLHANHFIACDQMSSVQKFLR